jgi:hypothetical protein
MKERKKGRKKERKKERQKERNLNLTTLQRYNVTASAEIRDVKWQSGVTQMHKKNEIRAYTVPQHCDV